MLKCIFATAFSLLILGCGTPPKTVNEFREQAAQSSWVETLDYEIPNATLNDVKVRLKKFADKCLHVAVKSTCQGPGACVTGPSGTATYTPKITSTAKQVSLSVQQLWTKSNVIYTSEPPKDGFFCFSHRCEGRKRFEAAWCGLRWIKGHGDGGLELGS